jgi:hypothetical protein
MRGVSCTFETDFQPHQIAQLNFPKDLRLPFAVKAINDTVKAEVIIPELLIFGMLLRLPGISGDNLPNRAEIIWPMSLVRADYE